jgi:CIC family chloride channel protein
MFAVVGMGGVFGAAAQAPLTSVASVVEMTGNFTLTVPVMLAAAIASALSKHLSYGSIYTTKLLRRGIDIDRPRPGAELQTMTVADVMQKLPQANGHGQPLGAAAGDGAAHAAADARKPWTRLVGPVADIRRPQTLFADETLEHALRQLVLYGHSGLPVISHDAGRVLGWVTRKNALDAIVQEMRSAGRETERGAVAAEFAVRDPQMRIHVPSAPPAGYELVEVPGGPGSPALGRRLDEIAWPASSIVVAATERREVVPPRGDMQLHVGERVVVLVPSASANGESATAAACEASAG